MSSSNPLVGIIGFASATMYHHSTAKQDALPVIKKILDQG
jgi:hypothetical protein